MKQKLFLAAIVAALFATHICVAQTNSRGVKRQKEECEAMALQAATNPRASGSGISTSESVAFNTAKLQARNELAAQVATEIVSLMQHKVEQYQLTAGAGTTFNVNKEDYSGRVEGNTNSPRTISGINQKDEIEIRQLVSQTLTNTRPICQNTYDLPNGSIQVYVCLEMGLTEQRKAYKDLKENGLLEADIDGDGKNDVDFNEKEFLLELAKVREEYNAKKQSEL